MVGFHFCLLNFGFKHRSDDKESTSGRPKGENATFKARLKDKETTNAACFATISTLSAQVEFAHHTIFLQSETIAACDKKLSNAEATIEQLQERLQAVEVKLDAASEERLNESRELITTKQKLEEANLIIARNQSDLTTIKSQLSCAHHTILTQSDEVIMLKSAADCADTAIQQFEEEIRLAEGLFPENEALGNPLNTIEWKSNQPKLCLKENIERILPCFQIGLEIRQRKMECDSDKTWDRTIVDAENTAVHHGRPVADATIALFYHPNRRESFINSYQITPDVVFEKRDFKPFIEILEVIESMRQWNRESSVTRIRWTAFKTRSMDFVAKIHPSGILKSDSDVRNDPEVNKEYSWLVDEAKQCLELHNRYRRNSH
ncbi:hypothetical protein G7Y89_g2059 [Cudoniella acicularis]|uniref:Uncharacterized protein n=1 Tax=Cudoniella acicularis TaxID=354080 RepID=A0A8H4W8Z6_9HELO|nr:hypothetical protein G7Y89_g2059 [Cudoniella acicularis]